MIPSTGLKLIPVDILQKLSYTQNMTVPTTTSQTLPTKIESPISPKAQVLRRVTQDIPRNEYGLIDFFYRADLIPIDLPDFENDEFLSPSWLHAVQDHLDLARIPLDYLQGFPTLPDGEPFWAQLPHETPEAHKIFVQYLDLPRQKHTDTMQIDAANAVRQVHALRDVTGKATPELLTMSQIYYWQHRAVAYDLFITASHRKRREYLLQDIENEHLMMASKYLGHAQGFLDAVFLDPEKFELSPSEAISLMKLMIQVQRLSVGASPFGQKGGKGENENSTNTPLEVILRTLVKQSGIENPDQQDGIEDLTRQLFQGNPDDLARAQELIIRLGDAKNPRVATHNLADANATLTKADMLP